MLATNCGQLEETSARPVAASCRRTLFSYFRMMQMQLSWKNNMKVLTLMSQVFCTIRFVDLAAQPNVLFLQRILLQLYSLNDTFLREATLHFDCFTDHCKLIFMNRHWILSQDSISGRALVLHYKFQSSSDLEL